MVLVQDSLNSPRDDSEHALLLHYLAFNHALIKALERMLIVVKAWVDLGLPCFK